MHSSLTVRPTPDFLKFTYDLSCSYSPYVDSRFAKYGFTSLDDRDVSWAVPTFYLNAHREYCRSVFSPHVLPEWACTNGEDAERRWAWTNPFASSTKEMGPGSRRDLLDDVFGHWNWNKVTNMRTSSHFLCNIFSRYDPRSAGTLLSRIKLAIPNRTIHGRAFQALSESIPKNHIDNWMKTVTAWEIDPRNKNLTNPFVAHRSRTSSCCTEPVLAYILDYIDLTQHKIRIELAEEDTLAIEKGEALSLHKEYTASTLIVVGLELEDQQCMCLPPLPITRYLSCMIRRRLRADLANLSLHANDLQRAKLLERQNTLQRRVDGWRSVQQIFMPCTVSLRAKSTTLDDSLQAQNTPLLLPSSICISHVLSATLLNHEWRLREAQAHDALADLRSHLEVRAYIFNHKDAYVHGQRENMTSHWQTLIDTIEAKLVLDAECYRAAYNSLSMLAIPLGKADWRGHLQKLDDSHICHISAGDRSSSIGSRQISWIWRTGPTAFVQPAEILNVSVNQNLHECKCHSHLMAHFFRFNSNCSTPR